MIVVPQPPSVPVSLKPREAIDVQAMQVQAQAMQALQTKPMPKAGVGNAAKSAKPKLAKVQQKKMPRKPQAPPQQAQTSAKAAKAVEKQGRAIPVKRMPLKRAASWDAASVVSAATVVVPRPVPKGQRQRVDAAAKPLAPADRATWFRGGGVGGEQPVGQNVGGSGVIVLFSLVSQHFQLQSSK